MLDLKRLRQDPDGTRAALGRRNDPSLDAALTQVLALDRRWRDLLARTEAIKAERNAASEEIARLKRSGGAADELMARVRASGDEVRQLDALRELARHVERDRVGALGPVQGDAGDPPGDLVPDRVQAGSARAMIASASTEGGSVPYARPTPRSLDAQKASETEAGAFRTSRLA